MCCGIVVRACECVADKLTYTHIFLDWIQAVTMDEAVRLDKWLWAARFFKTRTLATDAVDAGKVRLDGERVKPARQVRVGAKLDIDNGATRWEVEVLRLAEQRGSAAIAQTLYRETEASMTQRAKANEDRKIYREPASAIKGRPTKRDRRRIDGTNW